ncbi:MAG: hypothetical protein PHC70_04820 [Patescibacteria group bacterium]|nr:hypothetical protein [Patescibacteria group bacterium]
MTPGFWRAHHLIPAFIALVGLGMALGIAHFSSFQPYKAMASLADNVQGWAWSDAVGWISLNDQNPSACGAPPCGTYGLNVAQSTSLQLDGRNGHSLNGFAWSDNVGFICFGTSCNIPACKGAFVPAPPGTGFYSYVDPITDTNPKKVHGWGVICNQKDSGWISLNCEDTGTCNSPALPTDLNYRMVYNPLDQKFYVSPYNGQPALSEGIPFGWNGNSDGTGLGYISFYPNAGLPGGMHIVPPVEVCNNGKDDNFNSQIDCADSACVASPFCVAACPGACVAGATQACVTGGGEAGTQTCSATCAWDVCVALPPPPPEPDQPQCEDNPSCLGLVGEALANCCCNDNLTNGTHPLDCLDPMCVAQAPKVCSAWSKVTTGNIYAGSGISGTQAPKAVSGGNVKYCLRSNGTIDWTSESSCKQETAGSIPLPSSTNFYRTKLGFLDLEGIRSGRYGDVVPISSSDELPVNLAGKVYRYTGGGTFELNAKTFLNGAPPTSRGNGLLLIDGGNLKIKGDIQYSLAAVQSSLRNLASFGVVVVKNGVGMGGDIDIDPAVTKVSGTYFAEGLFSTGSIKALNPALSDANLKLYGILVAQQFKLQRNNDNPSVPAEEIIFDGRAVVNPPPGMQDASQSLPKADVSF